jgi:hypothetical protein
MDECTGHSHDHEHDNDIGLSLRQYINMDGVSCLNEASAGMGRSILKLHEERLSSLPYLRSQDDDPELLLHIPFTEAVTIRHISIRSVPPSGGGGGLRDTAPPLKLKLFVDREDLDFETVRELNPQLELTCVPPTHFVEGTIDYPLRPAGRFQNISSLTIYVESNFASLGNDDGDGDDEMSTIITFIGLKGQGSRMKRVAVEAVYETRGMPADHKVKGDFNVQKEI